VYIENIQLFPYLEDEGKLCVPGGELFSEAKTIWKYYLPSKDYKSVEDVNFVGEYEGESGDPAYEV
jgi:hypothetical protein